MNEMLVTTVQLSATLHRLHSHNKYIGFIGTAVWRSLVVFGVGREGWAVGWSGERRMSEDRTKSRRILSKKKGRKRQKSRSEYHRAPGGSPGSYTWEDIGGEPFFHGHLPRQESIRRVLKDGDFLVRTTEVGGKERAIISLNTHKQAIHFVIQQNENGDYYVGKRNFRSISDLIVFHYMQKSPLTPRCEAKLLRPVSLQAGEFGRSQIRLVYPLAKGHFGEVYKAVLKLQNRSVEVAVKKARKRPKAPFLNHLIKDSPKWRALEHPNVLKFHGISLVYDKVMLISELGKESLLSHLRRDGLFMVSLKDRLRYSLEAAKGMEYLARHGCLHNDLGARNCLMDSGKTLKLADYGIQESEVDGEERFTLKIKTPVKWQAPETIITSVYTFQTDIWSFGVLLWEIFSDGLVPYPGMNDTEVSKKVAMEKYRMDPPQGCPTFISTLMIQCWDGPADRPDFKTIRSTIEAGMKKTSMR